MGVTVFTGDFTAFSGTGSTTFLISSISGTLGSNVAAGLEATDFGRRSAVFGSGGTVGSPLSGYAFILSSGVIWGVDFPLGSNLALTSGSCVGDGNSGTFKGSSAFLISESLGTVVLSALCSADITVSEGGAPGFTIEFGFGGMSAAPVEPFGRPSDVFSADFSISGVTFLRRSFRSDLGKFDPSFTSGGTVIIASSGKTVDSGAVAVFAPSAAPSCPFIRLGHIVLVLFKHSFWKSKAIFSTTQYHMDEARRYSHAKQNNVTMDICTAFAILYIRSTYNVWKNLESQCLISP